MSVRAPSVEELARIAEHYSLGLSRGQLEAYRAIIAPMMASYERLDELAEPSPEVMYPDRKNWRPSDAENPLGAWYWRTEIKGASAGPLVGKTVAIKDNVCVAGVPMMNGTKLLEGYIPKVDATIVTRILDAGATILGKSVCESLCFSGNSHTSDSGIARNPYDPSRSPGGSSTGSAALVAAGAVDMAIGCDQAGSIRIPGSWSGICGLKPTWGLVPYTGIGPIEMTIDHTGPMTRTVADNALMLEVLAGPDGLDPRQRAGLAAQKYTAALTGDVKGLKVGVVKEGFAIPDRSQKDVDDAVREQVRALERLGCEVRDVSIPMHRDGLHIWSAIGLEGSWAFMIEGKGFGSAWKGYYPTDLIETVSRALRSQGRDLSVGVKMATMLGRHMNENYHGRYYARAQNLARTLAAAYDEALGQFNVLVMPTTPMKAQPIPSRDAPLDLQVLCTVEMIVNTCPFDVTGHPAISVPCAMSEGLPVGMMLIGRHNEEGTILRAADAFERQVYKPPFPKVK